MDGLNNEINLSNKELLETLKSYEKALESKVDVDNIINLERPFDMLFLPSKGLFYKNKVDSLILRNLSYQEENVLTSEFLFKSGKSLEFVYNNLCVTKDILYNDILLGDMEAVCLFLRSSAYGDIVKLDLKCSHCDMNHEEVDVRLSDFKMKECEEIPNEDGFLIYKTDKFEMELRPPSFKQAFEWEQKNMRETEKMASIVHSINGNCDKNIINNTMRYMKTMDSRQLKKFIEKNIPGVDARFEHECESCAQTSVYDFGLGYKFLELPFTFRNTVLEEIFLISYYGKGIGIESAKKMSVYERRWFLNRINEELTKKKEMEDKAARSAKSQAKIPSKGKR